MSESNSKHPRANIGGLSRVLSVLMVVVLLSATDGCTRRFFRVATDKEVNDILAEKDRYGIWPIREWHVYPDQRARFADPTNPDRPPMPPDDPATDQLSPQPQQPGAAGVGRVEGSGYLEMLKAWDQVNREERRAEEEKAKQENLKNPGVAAGPGARNGPIQELFDADVAKSEGFVLTLDQAAELAVVNNRQYQSVREDLYLAALPVTTQRFSFAWQWAAVEQAFRQWAGPGSLEGHQNRWVLNTNVGVTKLFSTGALLTTTFANTTVFNFLKHGNGLNSVSTINLDFIQPLLRGGGKAVTLEPLTQAERTLLYNIRAYWRFREQFFANVAMGASVPGSLPAAVGSSVGGAPISTLAALGLASTDVAGGFTSYLSTLYREVDMAADKKLVIDLQRALKILEGYQEGGMFSPLQVQQVTSQLLGAANTVLGDQQFLTNALDQFKLLLGVPANMPLILDDAPVRPITRQYDRYYEVISDAEAAYKLVEQMDQLPADQIRAALVKLYTTDPLVRGTKFRKLIVPALESWSKLSDKEIAARLKKLDAERNKLLDLKTDLELKGTELAPPDLERLRDIEFAADVGGLERALRRYEKRSWEKRPKDEQLQDRLRQFRLVAYTAEIVLVAARNERFDLVSTLWPELPPAPLPDCAPGIDLLTADVNLAQELAVQAALKNRVDLMNARAQVVDAWRQLRVNANALMGIFNVQFHMDSTTPPIGANPLAFATSRSNAELILQPELPLVRINERNAYRTAIINYQRARRNLINLEDSVAAQVRFDVRQLHLFANNYRIQKTVIRSLYFQVENALEVIVAPADPDSLKSTGTGGQAAAAALTSQYLGALNGLNGAQTRLYDIWLSYLATRIQLYLDLERLTLDPRGVWTDEAGQATLGQSFDNPASEPRPSGIPGGPIIPANPVPFGRLGAPLDGQPAAGRGPFVDPNGPRPHFLAPAASAPLD